MTASSTRCSRRIDWRAWLVALCLVLGAGAAYAAQGIEVKRANLLAAEEGYVLQAQFDVTLTNTLEDALHKGVSLYFLLEFEITRPRWYWFNERVFVLEQSYRLSYNPLTRQYRIGVGALFQNFSTLDEALGFMSRVRRRLDVEPGLVRRDNGYLAALRMRLDPSQLPKPFQLNALGSREWTIASEWYRWVLTP